MISEQVQIEMYQSPYKFFLFENFFDPEEFREVVTQLQEFDAWKLHIGKFFEQWEYKFPSRSAYPVLDQLFGQGQSIRHILEEAYDVPLSAYFDIVAHKLCAGQKILVHSDNPRLGYETHRFVINANLAYQDADGGHLFICAERDPVKIFKTVRPVSNTGFSFEASDTSYHAVGRVLQADRYSIIYSFWHLGNTRAVRQRITEALAGALSQYREEIAPREPVTTDPAPASAEGAQTRIEAYCLLRSWGIGREVARDNYLAAQATPGDLSPGLGKTYDGAEIWERNPAGAFAQLMAEATRHYFCADRWRQGRFLYLHHQPALPPAAVQLLDLVYCPARESMG
jgi:hypothetical protein